jgi:hypothetical protein
MDLKFVGSLFGVQIRPSEIATYFSKIPTQQFNRESIVRCRPRTLTEEAGSFWAERMITTKSRINLRSSVALLACRIAALKVLHLKDSLF